MPEICRENGISQNTLCVWKRKYSGVWADDLKRLLEPEGENPQLKRIVPEMALEIYAVKKVLRKNTLPLPSELRERS